MAVIGIDFDNTLVNGDKPIEGAREAINLFREEGHKVVIYSANNRDWIERTLNNNDIRFDHIWDENGKPNCDLFIDDKAFRFTSWRNTQVNLMRQLILGKDNRKW